MKAAFCILAVLSVLTATSQEQPQKKGSSPRIIYGPPYFYKAEAFIEMSEADRMLYTSGLMDGFFASSLFGASDKTVETLSSCTKSMDANQLSAIITKYVKDHPESWHLPLSVEAFKAEISRHWGASLPFWPPSLSVDHAFATDAQNLLVANA
jgi:hypothetical protein